MRRAVCQRQLSVLYTQYLLETLLPLLLSGLGLGLEVCGLGLSLEITSRMRPDSSLYFTRFVVL